MKKNISDEKLDKMLENLYNSEVFENFEFKSNYIPDKTEYNPEITVSGSEKHIKKTFRPSRIAAIAAAALIMVSIGTYNLSDNTTFSSPSSQPSDITVSNLSESAKTSLFDEYLAEFEYETANFNYECIKITPQSLYSNDENEQSLIDLGNSRYADLCYNMKIMPAYEGCEFEENDDYSFTINSDSEFYCYIKKLDDITIPPANEYENEYTTPVYTRQIYLVWKDENGNITKIRPSAEKVSAEDIANKADFNKDTCKKSNNSISQIINDFNNENTEVYINDILVRPSIPEDKQDTENKHSLTGSEFYIYIKHNNILTPVNVGNIKYNTKSSLYYDDEFAEGIENIPFFNAYLDNGTVYYDKTFFYDCSGDELIDISDIIEKSNENYWLETAERSEPAETSVEYAAENNETAETSTEYISENQTIDKEYILNHMLNSVDFFDTAEGKFISYEAGNKLDIEFAVNFSDNLSERFGFEKVSSDDNFNYEHFYSDKFEYSNNNGDINYYNNNSSIPTDEYIPASERMYTDENGDNNWTYRNDMNMGYSKECFMFQELIFSRLYDTSLWEITDEINMFGYDGIVLEGKTNSDNSFKIVAEKNTGIILDYEEYTGDELTSYIHIQNISINNGLSVNKAELEENYNNEISANTDKFCFTDLMDMDEENINMLIEKYGDALQRTDNGFTLCSYCLEQNGFDLSNINLYGDCNFAMSMDEFYENADAENKSYAVCATDGTTHYEVLLPDGEENLKPELNYETFRVEITSDYYTLVVHYPDNQPVSSFEKEMNEKFHNRPWAEIIK